MPLVEDTRQQKNKHIIKAEYFKTIGEHVVRCALPVGDYQRPAPVAVDTKKDINELAKDLKQDNARFQRELAKARDLGTVLVILVENRDGVTCLAELAQWVEPLSTYNARNYTGKAKRYKGEPIAKACQRLHEKYGTYFAFCTPEEAGEKIVRILDNWGR